MLRMDTPFIRALLMMETISLVKDICMTRVEGENSRLRYYLAR